MIPQLGRVSYNCAQATKLWYDYGMNTLVMLVLLGSLGAIFGSFVNALVWRLRNKRNWISERSECPNCRHKLASKDLVPIISWLILKGKCRYCKQKIDDNPLTEAALPILFIASYLLWPVSIEGVGLFQFVFWLLFLVGFMALAVYDLRWFILPNKIIFPLIGLAVAQVVTLPVFYHYDWSTVVDAGLGALLLFGIFYLLFQASKGEWLGGGDVKLVIVLGLLAGDPLRAVLVLFFASVVGTLLALPTIAKNGLGKKMKLPFGPLLITGMIIVQLFGTSIIDWYVGLLTV